MRARGYALAELLVAVAIAGLILGTLTFLNVDYVQLGRRAGAVRGPGLAPVYGTGRLGSSRRAVLDVGIVL